MKVSFFKMWVIVLLLRVTTVVPSVTAATIGLDARYPDGSESPQGGNYDEFRATIISAGHSLVYLNNFTTPNLAQLDALILLQPYLKADEFTVSEISAVHSFVGAGHGLLLIADGGNDTDSTVQNLNSLAGAFGATYAGTASHGGGFTVTGFAAHPVTLGVSSIGVDFDRALAGIASPASDLTLLSGEDNVLAAANGTDGRGNVVFVSDLNMWSDPDAQDDRDITFGDNRLLLQNTISFIAVPEPSAGLLVSLAGFLAWALGKRRNSRATAPLL